MGDIIKPGSLDAAILAGGRQPEFGGSIPNKTFVRIGNRPLFIHVLSSLLLVRHIRRIYIVGPKDEIEKELRIASSEIDLTPKTVIVLQESTGILENVMKAFHHSVANKLPGDADSENTEKLFFAIGGDSPLVLPEEVEQFIGLCDISRYDYFMGMTPSEVLEHFKPTANRRGISMAYSHFSNMLTRINNMHMARLERVSNRNEFGEIYRIRYLRNIANIIRMAIGLMKRESRFFDWGGWVNMFMAMWCRKMGLYKLSDYFRRNITIERVENVASLLLGTRAKIVFTTYGGAALDMDRPKNKEAMEENFDYWTTLQREIGQRYGERMAKATGNAGL